MIRWLIVLSCCWMPLAFADYQKGPGTRFDLGELTSEFKQAVPDLEGCDDTDGTVTCRRMAGDFTDAEKVAMEAALAAHDPDIQEKRNEEAPVEIPLGSFGAGAAGALAVLSGQGLVVLARKKKTP